MGNETHLRTLQKAPCESQTSEGRFNLNQRAIMLFLKAGWGPYQLADRVVVLFRCNGRKIVRFATQSVTEYNRKQSQEKVV